MKIVINNCFGGFGLSHEAVLRYAELKGITLYPEKNDNSFGIVTYWKSDKNSRPETKEGDAFYSMPLEERQKYNAMTDEQLFYERGILRDDVALVKVVEEMGAAANSRYSDLKVVEIPDNVEWQIEEYDGNEWVAEKHRTWR
jgi:hypothetical protein